MLLWFVIIYWIISVGIGLWAALRVKTTGDYAVAGRALPMYIVTATVFATWFGSETVLGIPATFIKEGFSGIVADPFGSSLCLVSTSSRRKQAKCLQGQPLMRQACT